MTNHLIARRRLRSQQLAAAQFAGPAEVVRWMGAVQSQDYAGARWAVAQRCNDMTTAEAIDRHISDGSIIRTHVLRPTWHFVAAEDAAWMLALTGPRVLRGLASRHRDLQLDDRTFEQCHAVLRQALAGGQQRSRAELETALNQAGIATDLPQRFNHILLQAELSGLTVSGAWQGKQNTYALLDERAPNARRLEGDAALAELARRYFASHGPAALKDFSWWSGLPLGEARRGIAACDGLRREEIDGVEYFSTSDGESGGLSDPPGTTPTIHLLPNYDEFVVAYADRSAIFDSAYADQLHMRGGVLNNVIVNDGLVIGGWSRELKKHTVRVRARPLWPLSPPDRQALVSAARQYAAHLGLEAELII